jgi:hypothetical protein
MYSKHVQPPVKKPPAKRQKTDPLAFKSSSKIPMCYFSNLFGGAEFTFMSLRTNNMCLKKLYEILREIDWDSEGNYQLFKQIRGKMGGKDNDHYRKGDRTAAGLLAKLISGCWRKSMKKRLRYVNELAVQYNAVNEQGVFQEILASDFSKNNVVNKDGTIKIRDDNASDKKKWMMEALRLKYAEPFFRDLLLKPEYSGIYERKGPRDTKLWCGNEYTEDAAGEPTAGLLMKCLADTKTFYQPGETKE